jgi:hypothetical protein
LAGLYNVSKESIGGFQLSAIFNYTDAQLSGLQLGMINKARTIKGDKSTPLTRARGLQLGLLNSSKAMEAWQISLINFGGGMRGKQESGEDMGVYGIRNTVISTGSVGDLDSCVWLGYFAGLQVSL